ncbi:MAG: InlB B-repeat-containing protein, partial [Prevotella sp.]|nr:InlB B-repeat-containing protein [Prevotella sp.]
AWTEAGLTLPTICYDGITAAPSLLGSHTATITAGGQTATLNFEITADVTYKSFFDFESGILEGTNYDVVSGTGKTEVALNNGSAGVWWDSTNKYAVFDGQAYLQLDNPLGNVDATTGFTIAIDVYISSDNNSSGSYYRTTGGTLTKKGYQRLFDLSDGTTSNFYCLNAGSAKHMGCARKYNNGSSSWLNNSSGKTYYNQWLTYTLVVFPGGYTTIYVDGTPIATESNSNTTATNVVNHLSNYNHCYIGTSIWEALGYDNGDAFFIGKIRGYQTAEGTLLPYWNGSSYQYLLTYKTNGGSSINAAYASALPSELPTTTRDGYTFGGWYTDEALTTAATPGAEITKNTFLYAKWTKYDVTAHQDPQHTSDYYTTFYDSYNQHQLPTGVAAYVGSINDSKLTLTKVAEAGDILPVATPVILKANTSSFTLNISTEDPVTISTTNDLKGFDETTTISTSAYASKVIYTLAAENSVVGFYKYTGSTLGANKAFLALDAEVAAGVKGFTFSFDDNATGVNEGLRMKSEEPANAVIYDLSGCRVSKPTKGVYIVNGKTIVVR